MSRKLRVFLCHASQDKPAVRELYNALNREGWIDPWLDKAKILPGQDWELVIEKAVDDADVVIVCLSNLSVSKEGFVQREIRYAYDIALEKPEETIFLIPLRLNDCSVPRKLRSLHWVNYFDSEKEETYSDLLAALKLRYDQKMKSEAEDLAQKQTDEQRQREAQEFIQRTEAERAEREKAEREKLEKEKREAKERAEADRLQGERENSEKKKRQKSIAPKFDHRLLTIVSVVLLGLIGSAFGINYLAHLPVAPNPSPTAQTTSAFELSTTTLYPKDTPTLQVPALTKVPATSTLLSTATSTPAQNLGIGSSMISPIDGVKLLYVPAGNFLMGSTDSDPNAQANEKPQHTVYLDAFWIDQTDVTNAMYAKCVAAGKCDSPSDTTYYSNSSYTIHPVVYVNWNNAKGYCEWAGRQLPTEAQWEKAARGTDGRIYPWGNNAPDNSLLNYLNNVGDTTEVGKYPKGASIYGALDMTGNVWQWVNDWYDSGYYSNSPLFNPLGPTSKPGGPSSGQSRVLRGGSWLSGNDIVRSAGRSWNYPMIVDNNMGFRCALGAK